MENEIATPETVAETTAPVTDNVNVIAGLSGEYLNHPSITKFNGDVNNLAKSYLSLEQMMGQGRVTVPKDENDAVAWQGYDKAFGVPEKAEGYTIANAPEGANIDSFKALMKECHIPQKTAEKLFNAYAGDFARMEEEKAKAEEQAVEDARASLQKEWGMKYDANMKSAANFLHKVCGNDDVFREALGRYGNDPMFIRILADMSSRVSEGSLGGMAGQSTNFVKTPAEAKAELDSIMNDYNDAYWTGARNQRGNPRWASEHNLAYVSPDEHSARVQYVMSLQKMIGG